ncbi:hypothetical protein BDV28DRAFT_145173 [Aspergillus coremiiformis]|uniref:BTB domain-containing protein n=1 Tax=Aspergillus coremiiformis TaxID=138285 RepID=A0A5N6ZFU1_9EURO|nr:hypothetical protein BDV28DRAFT_145173 [Aspergillus coremiiformis]
MDYIVDPEGDLLLVLEECAGEIQMDMIKIESPTQTTLPGRLITSGQVNGETALDPSPSASVTQSLSSLTLHTGTSAETAEDSDRSGDVAGEVIFKILVSSKHLTLVSPYFRSRLLRETADSGSFDRQTIPTGVDDLDVFFILLDIIHCQTRKVPRVITFQKLCKITVLAELYDCVEAVEAFGHVWAENLKPEAPFTYSVDLADWVGISWFFQLGSIFQETTGIAIRQSTRPIGARAISLPRFLVDEIENRRQVAIQEIVDCIGTRVEWELMPDGARYCCIDCDTLILGALMRQLKPAQLYPLPSRPFHGVKLDFALHILSQLSESRCNELIHSVCGNSNQCLLIPDAEDLVQKIDEDVVGLQLEDFLF